MSAAKTFNTPRASGGEPVSPCFRDSHPIRDILIQIIKEEFFYV